MKITVEGILRLPELKGVMVAAGRKGLNRTVNGIAIMESYDSVSYLSKNNLILTNAQLLGSNVRWASRLIPVLAKRNISGIALKLNRHMKEIPQEMIRYADELKFPILVLPAECTSTAIINAVTYEILHGEARDFKLTYDKDFLLGLLLGKRDSNALHNQAISMGWNLKKPLGVVALYPLNQELAEDLEMLCYQTGFSYFFAMSKHFVAVYDLENLESPGRVFSDAMVLLKQKLIEEFPMYEFYLGSGRCYNRLLMTSKSYEEAMTAMSMGVVIGKFEHKAKFFTTYQQLGMFSILLDKKNRTELRQVMDASIGVLQRFDKEHETEYFETLRMYSQKNYSVKETAAALYVHYNTVRHRLKRIKELMEMSMSTVDSVNIKTMMLLMEFQKVYEEICD